VEDYKTDNYWMKLAFAEAVKAFDLGEAPIGAVIVREGMVIGKGHNRVETLNDPTAHAEIIAIGAASQETGYPRLENSVMYVTLEPCTMCAGAIVLARIPKLVFGTFDPKAGACGSLYNICNDKRLNHRVNIISGIMEKECGDILKEFFAKIRNKKKTDTERCQSG
jgi:tRNA(adenine34) deaminase